MLDHDFFKEPNPINSYWAGFIAADGYISLKGNRIQIVTHLGDIDHLLAFSTLVASQTKFYVGKDNCAKMGVTSERWKADLAKNFSIVPQKSLTLTPPTGLNVTNTKAFIAGYQDGDGSLNYKKSKNWAYMRINIIGTQPMLEWIQSNLPQVRSVVRPKENVFTLDYNGKNAFEVHNYLWNPRLPLLTRKWGKPYKVWIG